MSRWSLVVVVVEDLLPEEVQLLEVVVVVKFGLLDQAVLVEHLPW